MLIQNEQYTPGSLVREVSLVLGSIPYKERDRIVTLLTPQFGKIRVFARAAARSRKRFGGCLDGIQIIQAQLCLPRESTVSLESQSNLWLLKSADLEELFPQWRLNYGVMENLFFLVRFIQEVVPDSHSDEAFYKGVIEFLRVNSSSCLFKNPSWWRASFWSWAAHFFGFGNLIEALREPLSAAHEKWPDFWVEVLSKKIPDLKRLDKGLEKMNLVPINQRTDKRLYEEWLRSSGITWEYFEKWLKNLVA
jgi:hypothetical protein